MIYKCPKPESRDCGKCLFEGICYDSDECRNAVSTLPVLEADVVHFMEED